MGVGDTQVFVWIHRHVVNADFVMKVWTSAAAAVPDIADGIASVNVLAGKYCEALEMAVASCDSVTVVENNGASVAAHEIGKLNHGLCRSNDRLAVQSSDVDAW